jgi:hypothetical protein
MSIRKRIWGPENKNRKAWVLDYYDHAGKRRCKTFKRRRDAEAFAETTRVLTEGSAFLNDDRLDITIHQGRLWYGRIPKPLTIRAIIYLIGKIWRANTRLSDAERTFLIDFAGASERGLFIEDSFFGAAIDGGKTIKTYSYRLPEANEDAGWVGLHRFFGMYVVNHSQYGEGQDEFGPFAKQKDGNAAFSAVVRFGT